MLVLFLFLVLVLACCRLQQVASRLKEADYRLNRQLGTLQVQYGTAVLCRAVRCTARGGQGRSH